MEILLTPKEEMVLRRLHDAIITVTRGETADKKTVSLVVGAVNSWVFPILFEKEIPSEIATICKSLLEKGLVKEFKYKGYPSFVPVSQTNMVEYSYREFTQSDIF